jgi:dUTP pyrophosphatase
MKFRIVNRSEHNLTACSTEASEGMDLWADLKEKIILKPRQRVLVPIGLFNEIKVGYKAQIRPRNGLPIDKGITVLNSQGKIDADYRSALRIILVNLSNKELIIKDGERNCQMVIVRHK